jgi:mannose/cellobiose epimerase-like protein (N-acyl-D-glucosamine 2-epimerase family)
VGPPAGLIAARDQLKAWLLDHAFKRWWHDGADLEHGGFHDRLELSGAPVAGDKRARVQARQAFSYGKAADLGWRGPAVQAMRHGLDFLTARHLRSDGLYRTRVGGAGASVDLYDQAFVLLALATARSQGETGAEAAAEDLLARLPLAELGGFREFEGAELCANPNMHLLEACLAWMAAGGGGVWRDTARGLVRLAAARLIDPATGALGETFLGGWQAPARAEARRVEPGHQFEWAWLLMRWSELEGDSDALATALALLEVGERAGVDPGRGVAINLLDGTLRTTDGAARLWPQTERLRAGLLAGRLTGDENWWEIALGATRALGRYLDVPTPGLWRDCMTAKGAMVAESAPASSLYHIVGAILELDRLVGEEGMDA